MEITDLHPLTGQPLPKSVHTWWGSDSARPFTEIQGQFAAHYGHLPTWVGRYLSAYVPDQQEITSLHANKMALLLIWNAEDQSSIQGDYQSGHAAGQKATAKALALGCPKGRFLPVDIEAGWSGFKNFLAGYIQAVGEAQFVGGAYLNAQDPVHCHEWVAAKELTPGVKSYIYSSEPEPFSTVDQIDGSWYDFTQTPLGTAHAGDVVAHQYGENEGGGNWDLDNATDLGYSLMWTPPPSGPQQYKALATVALKILPNHLSPAAIDPQHHKALTTIGEMLVATGRRTPHWVELRVPNSPVHGWLQFKDVQKI